MAATMRVDPVYLANMGIEWNDDMSTNKAHSPALVSQGPQGQVDPTEFVNTH